MIRTLLLMVAFSSFAHTTLANQTNAKNEPEIKPVTNSKNKTKSKNKRVSKSDIEARKIGEMVQRLQIAIKSPYAEESLNTISLYGTDNRYYSMIRGWLFQELVGVESQLHASKSVAQSEKFQHHSNFLKQAIRMVDLE